MRRWAAVVLANSTVFADAMVAGGFSARGGHPVLLTPGDSLDDGVAAYLAESEVQHVVAMGGTAAVSQQVQDAVDALGVSVTRLGGSTRLHTAQVVAEFIGASTRLTVQGAALTGLPPVLPRRGFPSMPSVPVHSWAGCALRSC